MKDALGLLIHPAHETELEVVGEIVRLGHRPEARHDDVRVDVDHAARADRTQPMDGDHAGGAHRLDDRGELGEQARIGLVEQPADRAAQETHADDGQVAADRDRNQRVERLPSGRPYQPEPTTTPALVQKSVSTCWPSASIAGECMRRPVRTRK